MPSLLAQFPQSLGKALPALGICLALGIAGYAVYQVYFHPLARFPGPFLASVTDLWQVYQFLTLRQPYNLTELHGKYGQFVRYGPDKLSITAEDAVPSIYQKGGRMMPKTEYYDAFGAAHPNVFGMRDEAVSIFAWLMPRIQANTSVETFYPQTPHVTQFLHQLRQRNGEIPRREYCDP